MRLLGTRLESRHAPDIAEEERFVAVTSDLVVRPGTQMGIHFQVNNLIDLPALCFLRAIKFNNTSRNEEQPLRSVVCVNDLSVIALYEPVKHVQVRMTEDEEASWRRFSKSTRVKLPANIRDESTPDIRATVSAASMTSPGSSS